MLCYAMLCYAVLARAHGREKCAVDAALLVIDVAAWKREGIASRLLESIGMQRRTDQLYLHPQTAGSDPTVGAQLVLDHNVMRLPSRWLMRGLAREQWSHDELSYWQRHWGQQGLALNFAYRPVRAPAATEARFIASIALHNRCHGAMPC